VLSAPVPPAAEEPPPRASEPLAASMPLSAPPMPAEVPVMRTFDVPSSRRRPVVFEEDDDLDVPDFLK
jgi:cell division protein FtsZ